MVTITSSSSTLIMRRNMSSSTTGILTSPSSHQNNTAMQAKMSTFRDAPRSKQVPPPDPTKRTRKTHTKVRTGCLTCKIRRKKCDETKPACVRCTSTGRKCDGYLLAPSVSPASTSMTTTLPSPVVRRASDGLVSLLPSSVGATGLKALSVRKDDASAYPGLVEVDRSPVVERTPGSTNAWLRGRQDSMEDQASEQIELAGYTPTTTNSNTSILPSLIGSLDSGYATPELELDKFADEELEDFILSYVSPTQDEKTASSDMLISNESPAPSKLSPPALNIKSCLPVLPTALFDRPSVPRSPCAYGGLSEVERHCFTYFRYHTGPSFSSYFESSIWRAYAVSAALAHPVVLTCAAACGAAHRRFGYGISPEAFAFCAHADQLHKKALAGLLALKQEAKERPGNTGVHDRDAIMIAELLLGLFQGFQGNYRTTVEHINNGVRHLLARPLTLVHTESRSWTFERQPYVFRQLIHRLRHRARELFRSPENMLAIWGQGRQLPSIPASFADLEEARDFIFTEVEWIMHAPARVWRNTKQRTEVQDLHVRRLLSWSVAYAKSVQDMDRSSREKKACTLLKLVRSAAFMLLYLTFFVDGETEDNPAAQDSGLVYISKKLWEAVERREELNTKLETIKLLVEGVLDENGIFNYDEHSVSFDSAISPTGNPTITEQVMPEKSGKVKHLVKHFMQKNPNNQALWEMLGVYGVAERISAVEEHAVIDSVRGIIPESIDLKWVDITCLMESRRILLRYCRPDEHDLGLTWTQEWWTF